jgi:sugar phosphate permease
MKTGVRHLALFGLCAMSFISYIDRVNISVAAPMIRKELGLSATELGLIFSAFAYPYAFMQIYGGWLADRFGPRLVLTILSALWALATVMTGISSGVASLVLWRVLVGVGEGSAFPAATRAFAFWMPAAERRRHAADRSGDRAGLRLASVIRRARTRQSGLDDRVGSVLQGHAGRPPVGARR